MSDQLQPSAMAEIERIIRCAMNEEFMEGNRWEITDGRVVNRHNVAEKAAADIEQALKHDLAGRGEGVEQERLETPHFHEILLAMREAMESHPFWRKVEHTPAENDLPVRAASVAQRLLQQQVALASAPSEQALKHAMPERQAIARIIAPDAFGPVPFSPDRSQEEIDAIEQYAEEALAKADAILSLTGDVREAAPERELFCFACGEMFPSSCRCKRPDVNMKELRAALASPPAAPDMREAGEDVVSEAYRQGYHDGAEDGSPVDGDSLADGWSNFRANSAALASSPMDAVTARGKLTPEYLAMTPLQKWETLALHGLLGTDEPWIEDMRETLRSVQAAVEEEREDPECTDCDGAGITKQTERPCACSAGATAIRSRGEG
jgi:hypothetical protein